MKLSTVLAHFGTRAQVATALGISRAAVSKWADVVPEGSAYKLESITGRKLRVDPSCYEKSANHAA